MKKRAVLIALMMLTAFAGYSQKGTTIELPFEVAKQIALDLEELDRLQSLQIITNLELIKYKDLSESLQEILEKKNQQLGLLRKNNKSLQAQLDAKKPDSSWWKNLLKGLGAFALGFLAGSIAN